MYTGTWSKINKNMSTVIRGIDDVNEVLRLLDDFSDNENDLLESEDDLDLDLDGDLESYNELPVRVNQNESVCQITDGTVDQDPHHDVVGAGAPPDLPRSSIEKPKPSQGPKQGLSNKIFYGNRGRSRPLSRGRGLGRSTPKERPIRPRLHNGSSPSRSRSNIGSRSTRTRPRGSARGRPRPPGTNRSASRPSSTSRPTGNATRPTDHGFIWEKIKNDRKFRKFAEKIGPQRRYTEKTNELEYFEEYFTLEVWKELTHYTNLNAETKRKNNGDKGKWAPVSIKEIKTFIGLVIAMGIIKLPSLALYWQKKRWFFDIPSFSKVMPRDRFNQIWRYLHFCDESKSGEEQDDPTKPKDKLFKIRPLLASLLPKYETVYVPEQIISIDESMIPFKGRIGFRQYIKSKRTRFGIKVWVLAESSSG